jgi:hypothetical protein
MYLDKNNNLLCINQFSIWGIDNDKDIHIICDFNEDDISVGFSKVWLDQEEIKQLIEFLQKQVV